jgi:hypothetical protein
LVACDVLPKAWLTSSLCAVTQGSPFPKVSSIPFFPRYSQRRLAPLFGGLNNTTARVSFDGICRLPTFWATAGGGLMTAEPHTLGQRGGNRLPDCL